jgi:hypothetical protein
MVTKADFLKHGFQEIYLLKDDKDVEPWAVAGLKYDIKAMVKRIEDLEFLFLPPGKDVYGGAIEGVNTIYRPLTDEDLGRMSIRGGKLFMVWTP